MGGVDSNPDCSKVGINDTVVSNIKSGTNSLSNLISQSIGSCLNAIIVPNSYSLGGHVVKFGGTNPGARTLESTASLNSSITPKRVPRSTSAVPHPSEILPGLIQNRYSSYFEDSVKTFDEVPASSVTVLNLPEYKSTDGSLPAFSNNWTGYFIPDYTGTWTFRMTADDAAYLYIGNNAVLEYARNIKSATIDLGLTHVALSKTATVELVKDKIYPFRIMYGNWIDVSVFKVEFLPPGFTTFETDFTSLLWHSTPGSCSNWGMDYVFVGDLGFEKAQIRTGNSLPNCTKNYASATSTATPEVTKKQVVSKPTFSLINVVGNKLNIDVNLGAASSTRPDTVYLVAPKLGSTRQQ
jgi:hypothetical protein